MAELTGKSVSVIGGGTMGAGICQVLLAGGASVRLVEQSSAAGTAARQRVADGLAGAKARGKLDGELDELLARLTVAHDLAEIGDASLVIESVPESLPLKRSVLAEVEKATAEDTIIASNTSSLSIDELADALQRSERFLGLHFFNPVPASSLIEIVRGSGTSAAALAAAQELGALLGKETILVDDSPGFATSRLGVLLGLEAIRMVEDGVASAEDIDRGMVLGYKHPMGPLKLTDLIGIDVRLAIAEDLAVRLGDRFEPPQLMRDLVAAGKVGKKSGQGFYAWR